MDYRADNPFFYTSIIAYVKKIEPNNVRLLIWWIKILINGYAVRNNKRSKTSRYRSLISIYSF